MNMKTNMKQFITIWVHSYYKLKIYTKMNNKDKINMFDKGEFHSEIKKKIFQNLRDSH